MPRVSQKEQRLSRIAHPIKHFQDGVSSDEIVLARQRAGESGLTHRAWSVQSHVSGESRAQAEVLVLDADFRQALAAMRSLSRAGVSVGAVACRSEAAWAPAFRSRWCRLSAVVPDFNEDAEGYVDALLALLDERPARLILPSHDGSIEALRARRAELERRTSLPLASEAALDIAVSKTRTLALATELGIAVPRSVLVTDPGA